MRIRRFLPLILAAIILVAGGYAAICQSRATHRISLAPEGVYAVGRSEYEWTDRTRTDEFAPIGGQPRVLSVWIWYPVLPGTPGDKAAYAPGAWKALHRYGFAETDFRKISTGLLSDASIASGNFPIVVLTPALGMSAPQYSSIASSLAAKGYLVAGVTPSFNSNLTVLGGAVEQATAAGNPAKVTESQAEQIVRVWAADARYVAEQTAFVYGDRTDGHKVLYLGHSLGGAAALSACREDTDCVGVADLDGTPYGDVVDEGMSKPTLVLGSGSGGATVQASSRAMFANSTHAPLAYTITGAGNYDFTDYAAYYLASPLRRILPLGSIAGTRALTIVNGYVGAFADHAAQGTTWTAPTYPEVRKAAIPAS